MSDLDGLSGATIDAYTLHARDLAAHITASGQWAGAVSTGLQVASSLVQAVYELVRDAISQVVGTAISAAITTAMTVGIRSPVAIGQIATKVASLAARVGRFVTKLLRSLKDLLPALRKLGHVIEAATTKLRGRLNGGRVAEAPKGAAIVPPARRLGGHGASEGWRPLTKADVEQLPIVRDGSHLNPDGSLKPSTWYRTGEHDYIYHTDTNGHIDRFHAEELGMKTHDGRLSHDARTPGKMDGDHAGHLAGDQFGGSPKLDNIVSQLSEHNLKNYRDLERDWAKALKSDPPGKVSVDVKLVTDAAGRPSRFIIESIVNGELVKRTLRQ